MKLRVESRAVKNVDDGSETSTGRH